MKRVTLTLVALALAACSSSTGGAPPTCGSAQASCAGESDCCPGFTCTFGSCVFQSGGGGSSSGSSGGSSSASRATSSGASSSGTSGTGTKTGGSSSGGKTSSGSSSVGGSSGGSSGSSAACQAQLLYSGCETNSDCGDCGLICVLEPNILLDWAAPSPETVCEIACTSNAECPLAETVCRKTDAGSACQFNMCDKAGRCNVADAGDGTCTAFGLCYQGGTATTDCDTFVGRANLAELCPAGQACVGGSDSSPGGDGPGICQPVCGKGLTCPSGTGCEPTLANPAFPLVPDAGSCTKSIKGPGGKSTLDCQPGFNDGYTTTCSTQANCPAFQFCLANETYAVDNCQCPCVTTADCPQVDAICINDGCQQNLCQQSNGPGDPCNAEGSGDGTCNDFEICLQAGTATKVCDTAADRTRPDLLCKQGDQCNPPPDGGTIGSCGPAT